MRTKNVTSTRGRSGALKKADREAAIEKIVHAVLERGITGHFELARITGLNNKSVSKLLQRARERIARECPPPPQLRHTYIGRLDGLFRKAIDGYERAREDNDERIANEFLKTASETTARAAKIAGLEDLRPEGRDNPAIRVVFERWGEDAPPAALAAMRRLSAAPSASNLPRANRADAGNSGGSEMGQRHGLDNGDARFGDGMRDAARVIEADS